MGKAGRFLTAICTLAQAVTAAERPPDVAEQSRALAAAREYALNYTNRLPDFTCTQVTQRTTFPVMGFKGHPIHDSFEEQIVFANHQESYTVTKVNGEAVTSVGHHELVGIHSTGEFGTLLSTVFGPKTGTDFHWERAATQKGQRMYVFAFRVPQATGYGLVGSRGRIVVAYHGRLYADPQTGAVSRIEMQCDIPKDSEYELLELTLDYRHTEVAGSEFLLPSHYHLHSIKLAPSIATNPTPPARVLSETTNEADFKAYRRFDTDSSVKFGVETRPRP